MSQVSRTSSLRERLESNVSDIEQTILARVYAVSDPTDAGDPEYVAGLRAAVAAAVGYGLSAVEVEGEPTTPIPPALFAQARHAARNNVSLDTVLRRYFAGYTLLGDFIMEEAEGARQPTAEEIHRLTRAQASLFDHLVVAVTEEYRREKSTRTYSQEHARYERVRSLLAGRLVDVGELSYDLEGWHLGLIAMGPAAADALREVASSCDRRLLLVRPTEGTVWAWLGGRREFESEELSHLTEGGVPASITLALGEPGWDVSGWRLTHRQARSAMLVASSGRKRRVRYSDVSLVASALQDEVLARSLVELCIAPLESDRNVGASLRDTLRAYFAAGRNSTSAAAALGISRRTVNNRLRIAEDRLGKPLSACAAEMEVALRMSDLTDVAERLPDR